MVGLSVIGISANFKHILLESHFVMGSWGAQLLTPESHISNPIFWIELFLPNVVKNIHMKGGEDRID